MTRISWAQRAVILALPLLAGAVFHGNAYATSIIIFILINGVLAIATCFCMGHAGQITLAQAGFFAIGAYASTLVSLRLGLSLAIGIVVAIILAGIVGYLMGRPIMKIRGHYLGLVTLSFTMVVQQVAEHWTSVTGGASGLYGIERPSIPFLPFDTLFEFLLLLTAYWFVVFIATDNLINSRYGRAMHALKYSDWGAQACGIDIARYKTEAFAISAGMMGGVGAFYAHFVQYIGPESFSLDISITVLAMCILGGMTDLRGAMVGALILGILNEPLRAYPTLQPIAYALIIIGMIIFLPRGVVPSLVTLIRQLQQRRSKDKPQHEVAQSHSEGHP